MDRSITVCVFQSTRQQSAALWSNNLLHSWSPEDAFLIIYSLFIPHFGTLNGVLKSNSPIFNYISLDYCHESLLIIHSFIHSAWFICLLVVAANWFDISDPATPTCSLITPFPPISPPDLILSLAHLLPICLIAPAVAYIYRYVPLVSCQIVFCPMPYVH